MAGQKSAKNASELIDTEAEKDEQLESIVNEVSDRIGNLALQDPDQASRRALLSNQQTSSAPPSPVPDTEKQLTSFAKDSLYEAAELRQAVTLHQKRSHLRKHVTARPGSALRTGLGSVHVDKSGRIVKTSNTSTFSSALPKIRPLLSTTKSTRRLFFHFIRNAEAIHNVFTDSNRGSYVDPPLTAKGMCQASRLGAFFPPMSTVKIIFASPLNRALHTALIAFKPHLRNNFKKIRIDAFPECRAEGYGPSSRGSSVNNLLQQLMSEQIQDFVNFSALSEGWEANREPLNDMSRASHFREQLYKIKTNMLERGVVNEDNTSSGEEADVGVVIVSHGDFLAKLLRLSPGTQRIFTARRHANYYTERRFWNAEYKTFEFAFKRLIDSYGYSKYDLIETQESRKKSYTHLPSGISYEGKYTPR